MFAYQIGFENIDYEWVVFAKLPKTSDQLHTNEHLSRFDGQLILPYMTPAQLEMEDGDVVDVFQARCSCFGKVGGWGLYHGVLVRIVKSGHRWWHCSYRRWCKKGRI